MQTLLDSSAEPATDKSEITKKCPYCAERIQNEAVKCRYCGEFLVKPPQAKSKWYRSTTTVIIALLSVGPLALPLVWFNPRYNTVVKLIITVGITVLTVFFCCAMVSAYNSLFEQIRTLGL